MNAREYYDRQEDAWEEAEIQQVRNEYEVDKLTISQIGDIHRRTPGSITYKLKNQGLITQNLSARGYDDYKNSDLYKEIVANGREIRAVKKVKKVEKAKIKIEKLVMRTASLEIIELKEEIKSIKKDVKEMLRLMNALYDFETE